MAYQKALAALSDPTRLAVLERLRAGPMTVGQLADGMPVSRPAVSQHLRALKDAGLVRDEPRGTARIYRIHAEGLRELRDWLDTFWDDALARFKDYAEGEKK
ncbi:ArsR/SmtB family transcription factor [Terricaulis silvestris]|uniref:HTH-type transcriptional regulator n=1 Tax=Terricaulis silvestris TaxID=2686094 RepID=A0A6I6MT20_9CAUL|nr:metalloregulator ArsR/SmtB family transcription factor [Terricaulis silvestris]QGZ95927.1 HTH-type transcriptional regulator [Terricaulis silvestris]